MHATEVEYILNVHEFISDNEKTKALYHYNELRKIIDFIQERVSREIAPITCTCKHCESIREPRKKTAPITFSLDS